ncbi:MAG: exo-alpha-sialidase [Planctomycetaceae bacterium]|nr:exo-alpha-sialidase [Planctomycetaceae bacterium]
MAAVLAAAGTGLAQDIDKTATGETKIDLTATNAADDWKLLDSTASITDGELVFDGRKKISRAFYLPHEWKDVSLRAEFMVEPAAAGVLACGFMVRASSTAEYYYVHFDRGQAILVQSSPDTSWKEIRRVSGLNKPAGTWHTASLTCRGNVLSVSLNGKELYSIENDSFARGRIGFYGSQGIVHVRNIVVEGTPLKPAGELKVPPRDYSIVAEDAGAGAYEAFPDVCRLNDGRLMTVYYAGYSHVALPNEKLPLGGRISCSTSDDEGRTWSEPATLYDGPDDDRDPSLMQLPDGRLICNFFSLKKTPGSPRGFTGQGTWIVTSNDLGKTWSKARKISDDYCSSPIRRLKDGRLILGLYHADPKTAYGTVIYSDDHGDTWSDSVAIDNGGIRLDAETDLIELKDGSLYAVLRAKACYSISRDRGETWTVSEPIGFPAHCPYLHRTVDGIILLGHRLPGTSLHYSLDECKTWSENVPVDTHIGAYPSMVNLKDGTVLFVYYEEGGGSNIRAKRLKVTPEGVTWLPYPEWNVEE